MSSRHRTIAEVLDAARERLDRVRPEDLRAEHEAGALVVDTRCEALRREHGDLPFGIAIERNVLEWRLDPSSGAALPEASHDLRVVVVCQEGYSSSLVAAGLRDLGIVRATDLEGGYDAWLRCTDEGPAPFRGPGLR